MWLHCDIFHLLHPSVCLSRVHLPPGTCGPGFRTQRADLAQDNHTPGPKLPGEIAHSQSHGLTVEKCRGEGGEDGICEVEQRLHARTELPASRHMTSTLKVRENVLAFGNHCARVSVKCGLQIILEVRLLLILRNKLCINLMLLH